MFTEISVFHEIRMCFKNLLFWKFLEIFPIIVRVAQTSSSSVLQRQSLLILRNLAFSSTHKSRVIAECKFDDNCFVFQTN